MRNRKISKIILFLVVCSVLSLSFSSNVIFSNEQHEIVKLKKVWEYKDAKYIGVFDNFVYIKKNQHILKMFMKDGRYSWDNTDIVDIKSIKVAENGSLVLLNYDNEVFCINLDGEIAWVKEFPKRNYYSIECVEERIFVSTSHSHNAHQSTTNIVYCLDIITSNIIWKKEFEYSSILYVAEKNRISYWTNGFWVFAIDSDGGIIWKKGYDCYVSGYMYKNSISDKYLFISTYTCNPWEHKLTVVDVKNGNIAEEIRNLPQFFGYFYHNNKLYVQRGYGKSSIYNINDFKELGSVEGYIGYYSIYDGYPYLKKPVPDTERYFSKTITRVDPEKYKNDRHYEFDHGVNEFHVQKIDDAHFFITQAPDNRVICYSDKFSPSSPENDPDPEPVKSILKFTIDTKEYKLNGVKNSIDVAPIIKNGSTLLPARYVTEPLGGDVSWGEWEEKVICELGQNIVGLWIDLSIAEVNGVEVQIDPNNSKITPIIINDRTMVPMRFLAESLGCEVEWIAESKEIILTYSP